MRLIFIQPVILVLSVSFLIPYSISNAQSSNDQVFTSDSSPHGVPYSEWIGKWWGWWFGIPNDVHPVYNYSDTKRCSVNQEGPVWFLPDVLYAEGPVKVTCNVPLGKSILLPLTTTIAERAIETEAKCPDLAVCADNIDTPPSNINVAVDGVKVDASKLKGKTGLFNVTFPDNAVQKFGPVRPGTYPGMATGYFLFLHDLPAGTHNIKMTVADVIKPSPIAEPPREGSFDIIVK